MLDSPLESAIMTLRNLHVNRHVSPASFNVPLWSSLLEPHPNPYFRDFVLDGLRNGFTIGMNDDHIPFSLNKRNLPTTADEKKAVVLFLTSECRKGHMLGPFITCPVGLHVSPIGAVPKDITKFRIIHHLSAPRSGSTINNSLSDSYTTVSYISFLGVVRFIHSLGVGAHIWKIDLASAYRQIPLATSEFLFLGIRWAGLFFMDTRLPFGLSSSCLIFTLFADALQWIMETLHPDVFADLVKHYLDDFFGGSPDPNVAKSQFEIFLHWSSKLGVKVNPKKIFVPSTSLVLLGLQYDTISQVVILDPTRVDSLRTTIKDRLRHPKSSKFHWQSIVGKLRFATCVIRVGRFYIRSIEKLAIRPGSPRSKTRKTFQAAQDLEWWLSALYNHNQVSFASALRYIPLTAIEMYTDASGIIGCGAWSPSKLEFWGAHWPDNLLMKNILWKELFAVVVSLSLWCSDHTLIHIHTDNQAIMYEIIRGWSDSDSRTLLLDKIAHLCDMHHMFIVVDFISTHDNIVADSLSRGVFNHPTILPFLRRQVTCSSFLN